MGGGPPRARGVLSGRDGGVRRELNDDHEARPGLVRTPDRPDPATHTLRPYQAECVEAARQHVREGGRGPVLFLPTGSGKSHIIAQIAMQAARRGKRVLILAHRRELLQQNRDKLIAADPRLEWESCFYSAGLGEKSLDRPIVFAGIQSICKAAPGPEMRFDVVIVDECHRVPPPGAEEEGT